MLGPLLRKLLASSMADVDHFERFRELDDITALEAWKEESRGERKTSLFFGQSLSFTTLVGALPLSIE